MRKDEIAFWGPGYVTEDEGCAHKKNLKPSPLFLREKQTIVQYVLCLMKPMIWQVVTLRLDYNIEEENKKPWPHFRKEPALGKTTAKIEDVIQESAAFMYSC